MDSWNGDVCKRLSEEGLMVVRNRTFKDKKTPFVGNRHLYKNKITLDQTPTERKIGR